MIEYLKAILHLPLPGFDKLRCLGVTCLIFPGRGSCFWLLKRYHGLLMRYRWLLRITGPARIGLRTRTGWTWLSRRGSLGGGHGSRSNGSK